MKKILMLSLLVSGIFSACHLRARSKLGDAITVYDGLNYSPAAPHPDMGFDLYVPKNAAQNTPAVVFIHGGYWRNQSRRYFQAFTGLYQNFGLALSSRGIAAAVIDYRLFPQAKPDDQVADVENAVAYLKKNAAKYNINPQQIFLSGHSAGGHLALMAAWQRQNADIRGVIALSPILDIAHMRLHKEEDFNRELTLPFFGSGDLDGKYSPATYAANTSTPALIFFGEKDYAYLIEQGKTYQEKFSAAGLKQIRIQTIPDTDHSEMVINVHTANDKVSDAIARYVTEGGKEK